MPLLWALHIPDQVLLPSWWILGWIGAILWVMAASRGIEDEEIPRIGLFSAVFFLGTLFHLPFFSVHLLLPGIMGLFLGHRAILAILVAMLLQAGMGHGGFSTAGINTLIMGAPACLSWWLVLPVVKRLHRHPTALAVAGFCLGFIPVCIAVLFHALALHWGGVVTLDWQIITSIPLHLPVALAEGIFLASALPFLAAAGIPPFPAKEAEAPLSSSDAADAPSCGLPNSATMTMSLLFLWLAAAPAGWASGLESWHKLQIDWKVLPGNRLQVDAYFETGPDIEAGELILKDEKGIEFLRETKHKAGRFVVDLPESHRTIDLYVHAEDHLAHVRIPSKAFLGVAAPVAAGQAKENAQEAPVDPPDREAPRKTMDLRDLVLGLSLILSLTAFWMAWRVMRQIKKLSKN